MCPALRRVCSLGFCQAAAVTRFQGIPASRTRKARGQGRGGAAPAGCYCSRYSPATVFVLAVRISTVVVIGL